MQNVLADLTLESEAATALSLRMARALDNAHDEGEALLMRLGTGLGTGWRSGSRTIRGKSAEDRGINTTPIPE